MLRSLMLAGMVLLVASAPASAQERLVFGEGAATSCGSWTQGRQTRSFKAGLSAQWIAGYLSGLNMGAVGPDPLSGTDFDGLMAWIDNYCRSNPLDMVGTAAFRLMGELRSRVKR
jgi:hypothetical protein